MTPAELLTASAPWCLHPDHISELRDRIAVYEPFAPIIHQGETPAAFRARCDSYDEYIRALADSEHGLRFDEVTGIAVQPICGTILKGANPELELWCGFFNLARVTAAAERAATDPAVRALVFITDSPGGYSGGMGSTLAALDSLRASRPDLPVLTYVPSMCASGAYWLAVKSTEIHAAPDAILGSIGAYMVIADTSQSYVNEGIKMELFSSAPFKGMGAPGIAWTEEWKGEISRQVTQTGEQFKTTVAAHRPALSEALMNGLCFDAGDHAAPGDLVDSVEFKDAGALLTALAEHLAAAPAV